MALTQKTRFLQLRLEPELLAIAHQIADEKRKTVSALVRDLIYLEAGKREVEKKKKEMQESVEPQKTEIPHPDSFQLEQTAPAPLKTRPKVQLGRKERRLKEARDRKFERMELAEERKKASPL